MNMMQTIVPVEEISLAEVIARLERVPDLSSTRRRDLISAVNTVSRLLRRSSDALPANLEKLRGPLEKIHPVQAGISAKRLANVKSELAAAVLLTRTRKLAKPEKRSVSLVWREFLDGLERPWQRYTLSRLAQFCSTEGLAPADLSDAVVEKFHHHLAKTQLAKNPDEIVKIVRQTWNGIAERRRDQLPIISRPPLQRFITPPLTNYPQSLQDDLRIWLDRLSHASMFDEDAPPRVLRPSSLRNIKASIRQFAHALVESGIPREDLTCFGDLVELKTYRAGLQHLVKRNGGAASAGAANVAAHLVAIAKHFVKVDAAHLNKLVALKSRLVVEHDGLTEKNKARLGQFTDERNIERLLRLSEELRDKAKAKKAPSSRDALNVMYAVAIDILLACPMRIGNVASLDVTKHLKWYGHGRHEKLAVRIPGTEVKNGQPIEVDLPRECVQLIKTYLAVWHPMLVDRESDALFPMRDGRCRLPGHLSQELKRVIHRETGIEINAHLFRHLAGMLYLEERPGEYETVRRLLGHRKLSTTTSFYAPLENARAVRQYDDVVLAKRKGRG